jgi:hypothetical protein
MSATAQISRIRTRVPPTQRLAGLHPVAPGEVVLTPTAQASTQDTGALSNQPDLSVDISAYWLANTESNRMKGIAEKAKKVVNEKMLLAQVTEAKAMVTLSNGGTVPVIATILPTDVEVVSVSRLKDLVDAETFMRIISATKTATVAIAGENIYLASKVNETKPAAIAISAVK